MNTTRRQAGRSLVELTISLSLGAMVVTLMTGAFVNLVQDMRLSETTNELQRDIERARQHVMNNATTVALCASADGRTCIEDAGPSDWTRGWIAVASAGLPASAGSGQVLFASRPAKSVAVRLDGAARQTAAVLIRSVNGIPMQASGQGNFSIFVRDESTERQTQGMRCLSLRDSLRTSTYRARDRGDSCTVTG
jgi:Tfp pilus assembly protein FimT